MDRTARRLRSYDDAAVWTRGSGRRRDDRCGKTPLRDPVDRRGLRCGGCLCGGALWHGRRRQTASSRRSRHHCPQAQAEDEVMPATDPSDDAAPGGGASFLRKWTQRIVVATAVAYPVAVAAIWLCFRYIGESWWATGVGLYLPRIGFALPLPLLVALLLLFRLRRLLWTQLVAVLLVVFPLMGLIISFPGSLRQGEPALRILSFNVDSGYFGNDKIDAAIQAWSPAVVLLQDVQLEAAKLADTLRSRYESVEPSGQFIIPSRFPILSVFDPDRLPHYGRLRSPRFMHYLIDSPLGHIALYPVHPVSPRGVFYELRGKR